MEIKSFFTSVVYKDVDSIRVYFRNVLAHLVNGITRPHVTWYIKSTVPTYSVCIEIEELSNVHS